MLIIQKKESESIDRVLKRYKKKCRNTKLLEQLKDRKAFKKPSVKKREQLIKAQYKEFLYRSSQD